MVEALSNGVAKQTVPHHILVGGLMRFVSVLSPTNSPAQRMAQGRMYPQEKLSLSNIVCHGEMATGYEAAPPSPKATLRHRHRRKARGFLAGRFGFSSVEVCGPSIFSSHYRW